MHRREASPAASPAARGPPRRPGDARRLSAVRSRARLVVGRGGRGVVGPLRRACPLARLAPVPKLWVPCPHGAELSYGGGNDECDAGHRVLASSHTEGEMISAMRVTGSSKKGCRQYKSLIMYIKTILG